MLRLYNKTGGCGWWACECPRMPVPRDEGWCVCCIDGSLYTGSTVDGLVGGGGRSGGLKQSGPAEWICAEFELTQGGATPKLARLRFLGGVPEWPKGSDCKSDGSAFGGSNPPPSTKFTVENGFPGSGACNHRCQVDDIMESRMTGLAGRCVDDGGSCARVCKSRFHWRVLFNGRTSAFQADDVGSIPITRSKIDKVFEV
jgi:hypothetical protein